MWDSGDEEGRLFRRFSSRFDGTDAAVQRDRPETAAEV